MISNFLIGLITLGFVFTVPTGFVVVKTKFGEVKGVYKQGIHLKAPLGIENITLLETRILKDDVKTEAGSKDLQLIKAEIVVNYHLDENKADVIYQKIGNNNQVKEKILIPAVSEVVKASFSKKTAEEVLTKRPELKQDIDEKLSNRLSSYNIIVDDVSIVDVDFSDEFNKAIEAKQIAEQKAKQAIFEAERAKYEAVARVNKAEGEAKAQALQIQSLTPELLQKMAIEKWNGSFPTYYGGGALPFLNLK